MLIQTDRSMQGDVSTKIGVEQIKEQIGSRVDKVR